MNATITEERLVATIDDETITAIVEESPLVAHFADETVIVVLDPGVISDKNYLHDQVTPASIWTITHNLGKVPAVVVFDSAGDQVMGDIDVVDNNTITITFSAAFAGKAYLN